MGAPRDDPSKAAGEITPVGWSLRAERALVLLVLLVPSPAFPWTGQVTAVIDGDTIAVLREERIVIRIRLYGIDAPELTLPLTFSSSSMACLAGSSRLLRSPKVFLP